MYSPVFLSKPTTSGSPPVLSISLSDHSFLGSPSSFACTLVQSRPLWRFMFFSKRAFSVVSSAARSSTDNFCLLLMLPILLLVELISIDVSVGGGGRACGSGAVRDVGVRSCRRGIDIVAPGEKR